MTDFVLCIVNRVKGTVVMSYDLMVFEKSKAPATKKNFMSWYEKQTQWGKNTIIKRLVYPLLHCKIGLWK